MWDDGGSTRKGLCGRIFFCLGGSSRGFDLVSLHLVVEVDMAGRLRCLTEAPYSSFRENLKVCL
jgi:hypothetical protein